MYTLIVRASFEAAHDLPGYAGKCRYMHGHSYHVEAEFSARELDPSGMICDFTDLKSALAEFLPDHAYLNDIVPGPTTAENIARWIFDQLRARDFPVSAVTLWETDRNACRYTADE